MLVPLVTRDDFYMGKENGLSGGGLVTGRCIPGSGTAEGSLIGLLIDDLVQGFLTLEANGVPVHVHAHGMAIDVTSSTRLRKIFLLFQGAGIKFEIAEIAGDAYRG